MDTEPMFDHRSSESGQNLSTSTESSMKSKTFQPLAIAGEPLRGLANSLARHTRQIPHSLTIRLASLVLVFVALPVVLYGQFEQADARSRDFVARSIRYGSWMIAQALLP